MFSVLARYRARPVAHALKFGVRFLSSDTLSRTVVLRLQHNRSYEEGFAALSKLGPVENLFVAGGCCKTHIARFETAEPAQEILRQQEIVFADTTAVPQAARNEPRDSAVRLSATPPPPSKQVVIRNLAVAQGVTPDVVKVCFESFGPVKVRHITHRHNLKRYAFGLFENQEDADKLIQASSSAAGLKVGGYVVHAEYTSSEPKRKRNP